MLLWYSDNHTSLPASNYKCEGSFLTRINKDGTKQVAHLSSDMFKKLIKYSQFKSLDVLNIVREYVPDIELKADAIISSSDTYSLVFSSFGAHLAFTKLAEMIRWFQDNKYNVTPVYRQSPNVDNITFEIMKYTETNVVYVNINLITEYVGIIRGLDKSGNLFLGEVEWFKMKNLTPESIEDTVKSKILAQLEDDTRRYLHELSCNTMDSDRVRDMMKCINVVRRGKYDTKMLEDSLFPEDVEAIASGNEMSTSYFYEIASRILRTRSPYLYGEPVSMLDKFIKSVIWYNNNDGSYDYYGGLACQVED